MKNSKKAIIKKLHEASVSPEELKQNTDDLVKTAKDALSLDNDDEAKDYVSGFIGEDENAAASRGVQHGVNPEVGADKYDEYRALMQQMASEEGEEQPVKEEEGTNNPVKLKADVAKLMDKLDMTSIAPYLKRIDNPTEQAEVIAQFAERIGVPKAKLSSVVAQLRTVAETTTITKDKLIETVTGKKNRKIIKTVKVKNLK